MNHHGTRVVTIPGSLAPKLSPYAYVTAFYTLTGRKFQIVADYIQLNVTNQCLQELQVLHASFVQDPKHNIKQPAGDARLRLIGATGMLVGLLAVDKAVYVVNNQKSLSRDLLFSELASHNLGTGEKNKLDNLKYKDIFKKAGFILLTNMEIVQKEVRKPLFNKKPQSNRGRLRPQFGLSGPFFNFFKPDVVHEVLARPSVEYDWNIVEEDDFETISLPSPRRYFPESWLFQEELLSQKTKMISVKLPDSITTWVIEAVGVSASQGVCVSKPLELITFKPFFMNVRLPYKAVRLEKVNIRFSVFNYQMRSLKILVTITADEAICITDKTHGKKKLRYQTRIAPDSSKGNDYSVIPLKAGHHKIRLVVKGARHVDVIEKTLYIVAEGKQVKKTLSFPLDPTGRRLQNVTAHGTFVTKGSTIHNIWNLRKQEQKTLVDLALPAELIPGTDRCDIFAYGDLMADVIVMMLSGNADLMDSTVSDAEEVLGNLAPVIHAIKYIQLAKLKTPDVEEKGHIFVRNGVANLLKYRKSDGSFSLLPDSQSSTWFTAVVLKMLCQAQDIAHIDEDFINTGFLWLLDHINDDDTMEETDSTYDHFQSSQDKIPNLAAEVLIALMECDLTEQPDHLQLQASLLFYLEDYFEEIVDVLVLAKVAYALYLTESPDLPDVLHMLTNAKKVTPEGLVYWSDQEDLEEDMTKPHWYQQGPDGLTVEATAYSLLVSLEQTVTEVDVQPIAEWLVRQRGTNGAFVGALDTAIATQALAAYSLDRSTRHPRSDLHCNISTEHSSKYHSTINFSHKDSIVRKALSNVPTGENYKFISSGTGLGEVQIEASYNVPVGKNDNCRYNISVTRGPLKLTRDENIQTRRNPLCKYCGFGCGAATNTSDDNGNEGRDGVTRVSFSGASICVEICLRRADGKAGQGVTVEAGMLSGYVPLPISAEQMLIMTDGRVKSHKYDHYKEILVTHFHSVPDNESTCFGFLAKDQNVVSRHRPAAITLTEQGKRGASCSLSYDAGGEVSLPVLCTQPSESKSRECICTSGSCGVCARSRQHNRLFILVHKICSADYVYQIQYRESEQFGPWKRIPAEVLTVNKEGHNRVVPGQDIILNVPQYCRCPAYPPGVPHYLIGTDLSRTKDIEGIELFRYIVDDSTFFALVEKSRELQPQSKWKGYFIKKIYFRAALNRDKQKRC
ncbi:C3 and PZP-like alpha-2-macroglobulin domain-containing protein 8 [Gigantopelta aegis]|uniref:C3 and PZP-like alpha-2-macroglobulin domain-containing protein 8 n=1 Tax=Gigantopelta aegis TaxID=1735272 RepID=UPI001B88C511|nr:C3 and PZP-like alpha-2-macroglobulin domain-containing protein 8 [Gigantopelta aegis]